MLLIICYEVMHLTLPYGLIFYREYFKEKYWSALEAHGEQWVSAQANFVGGGSVTAETCGRLETHRHLLCTAQSNDEMPQGTAGSVGGQLAA